MSRLLFPRNLKLCEGAKNPKKGKRKMVSGCSEKDRTGALENTWQGIGV